MRQGWALRCASGSGRRKLAAGQLLEPPADALAPAVALVVQVIDKRCQPVAVLAAGAQLAKRAVDPSRTVAVDLNRLAARLALKHASLCHARTVGADTSRYRAAASALRPVPRATSASRRYRPY